MRVLVVNAGSSSVKLSLVGEDDERVAARELSAPSAELDPDELRAALDDGLGDADAVGHRIVHGGERFRSAVPIDAGVEHELRALTELAPLHQHKALAALDAVSRALPRVPAIACFDTAFHASMPAAAYTCPLPAEWRARWRLRRYGFHGLSHAWAARRVPELLGSADPELRIVNCHLGAGASLCAIRGGRSVDTTMGFTPLDGLVMATRSGSLDPGMIVWLLQRDGAPGPQELSDALEHESGLKGLAGSADMREVLARADAGEPTARLALDVYLHRLRGLIGAMAAALGGLDALVFTGGVGEQSAPVRAGAGGGLKFLGVEIDAAANAAAQPDAELTAPGAGVRTLVIEAREDLEIARQVRALPDLRARDI